VVEKRVGETPLECIERLRIEAGIARDAPMTYAGRLDPMASGLLLVLVGEVCKNKEKYTSLDKVYEVDIVFGVDTDTHDVLGHIRNVVVTGRDQVQQFSDATHAVSFFKKYTGNIKQEYPAFSSKTVDGVALHEHARLDTLPDTMPTRYVEIYSIYPHELVTITGADLACEAIERIATVKGDFRQKDIIDDWLKFTHEQGQHFFYKISITVACSSGTYMRSLAKRIGDDIGVGAIATRIYRSKIGEYV